MIKRNLDWYMVVAKTETGKYAYVFGLNKGDNIVGVLKHHNEICTMIACESESTAHVACDITNDELWVSGQVDFQSAKIMGWSRRNFDDGSKDKIIKKVSSENDSSVRELLKVR